jgi:hypothetical protein
MLIHTYTSCICGLRHISFSLPSLRAKVLVPEPFSFMSMILPPLLFRNSAGECSPRCRSSSFNLHPWRSRSQLITSARTRSPPSARRSRVRSCCPSGRTPGSSFEAAPYHAQAGIANKVSTWLYSFWRSSLIIVVVLQVVVEVVVSSDSITVSADMMG